MSSEYVLFYFTTCPITFGVHCIFLACTTDPVYTDAVVQNGTGAERQFTCDANYTKTVEMITCVANPATQNGNWMPASEICTMTGTTRARHTD